MPRLTEPLSRKTLGVVLGIAAAAVLAAAGWIAWGIAADMKGWQRTTGTVVGMKAIPSSGGRAPSHHAIVRFKTPAGETQLTSRSGSSGQALIRGYQVGQTLPVVYDPANLSRARIDSLGEVWLWGLVVAVPGLALLLTSVALLTLGRRA